MSTASDVPLPDPDHNSSDEDGPSKPTGQASQEIKELTKAVRQSLQINRTGSPELDKSFQFPPRAAGEGDVSENTDKLSDAARKIAHSRSTTDTAIVYTPPMADSPANASVSEGSDEESEKPPLIRKKSGELVKPAIRPKSRRTFSSMPGTPTYGKKGVHFNDDIQQVKHFLQVDRPIAVSAGGSPVDNYEDDHDFPFPKQPPSPTLGGFDIRLANFPRESLERQTQAVRLHKIHVSADRQSLLGQVVVANLSFHKTVIARFTFDFWKTTSEVLGEYCNDPLLKPQDGSDMFNFSIKLTDISKIENKTMFICVRYIVDGQEYWDNNSSMNFQVDFTRRQQATTAAAGLGARPIPRSRKSSAAPAKLKHQPSLDEDFSQGFDSGPGLKLKQPVKNAEFSQPRQPNRSSQQFGSRYDFGASLTAALSHAQSTLGDRSGFKRGQQQAPSAEKPNVPKSSITQRHCPSPRPNQEAPKAEALHADKPSLDSRAYQDFVSKFCFFGSSKPSTAGPHQSAGPHPAPKQEPAPSTDGAHDEKPPVPPRAPEHLLSQPKARNTTSSTNEMSTSNSSPPFLPRTGSPPFEASVSYGSRSSSPASIDHRFAQSFDHGLLSSGSATPQTAIHG
ncbi:MAG: hypothetical protein Q9162_006996 [Coniocarpon cinnabarinum]